MTAENPTGRSDEAEMATVINMKNRPDLRAALDGADEYGDVVRIDRRTRWGNPFLIGRHGSREEVIERYRTWLWGKVRKGEIRVAELAALNGKTLACHCAPLPCHGDVLVKAAAWAQARIAPGVDRTAREVPQERRTRAPVYAGVGARRTPAAVLDSMRDMARELAALGWHLRTGGATGADSAFAHAVPAGQRTVFVPWRGYNGWEASANQSVPLCRVLGAHEMRTMRKAAAPYHPAWERCPERVRDLHARNVAVVLGADTGQAVDATQRRRVRRSPATQRPKSPLQARSPSASSSAPDTPASSASFQASPSTSFRVSPVVSRIAFTDLTILSNADLDGPAGLFFFASSARPAR